jgi:enoyl-CoA hydratase
VRSSVDERPLLEAVDEGVLTLTLNRPEQRNALDAALRDALARALDEAAIDPEHREGLAAARERREPEFIGR